MKFINKLYSIFIRRRFASFGKGSYIYFPLKVNYPESISIGDNVLLRDNVWLNSTINKSDNTKLTIGNGCYIGRFVHINAYENVVIEDKVFISDRVYIADVDHEFADNDIPIKNQGNTTPMPVNLKKGCRIGEGVAILPGVTVGVNSVVGANAVVTKDIPDYLFAKGVPSKVYTRSNKMKLPP